MKLACTAVASVALLSLPANHQPQRKDPPPAQLIAAVTPLATPSLPIATLPTTGDADETAAEPQSNAAPAERIAARPARRPWRFRDEAQSSPQTKQIAPQSNGPRMRPTGFPHPFGAPKVAREERQTLTPLPMPTSPRIASAPLQSAPIDAPANPIPRGNHQAKAESPRTMRPAPADGGGSGSSPAGNASTPIDRPSGTTVAVKPSTTTANNPTSSNTGSVSSPTDNATVSHGWTSPSPRTPDVAVVAKPTDQYRNVDFPPSKPISDYGPPQRGVLPKVDRGLPHSTIPDPIVRSTDSSVQLLSLATGGGASHVSLADWQRGPNDAKTTQFVLSVDFDPLGLLIAGTNTIAARDSVVDGAPPPVAAFSGLRAPRLQIVEELTRPDVAYEFHERSAIDAANALPLDEGGFDIDCEPFPMEWFESQALSEDPPLFAGGAATVNLSAWSLQDVAMVPEPTTVWLGLLAALGLLPLIWIRRR